jgi:vitamin B12 transporter
MSFKVITGLLFLSISTHALSSSEIITVSADRINSTPEKLTSKVTVIEQSEIENSSHQTIEEILRKNSDLEIVTSGPSGNSSSLFIRGADASQSLVIVDGIIINDPSNPNRQADLSKISRLNIEKIEIIKGAQSILYGSNAIGGVVVITSKKSSDKPISEVETSIGSNSTYKASASHIGKLLDQNFVFGVDYLQSLGFSSALDTSHSNDRDGEKKYSVDLGMNGNSLLNTHYDFKFQYLHDNVDLDKGGGNGADDPNYSSHSQEIYTKLDINKIWNSTTSSLISYTFSDHLRRSFDNLDSYQTYDGTSFYRGQIHTLSIDNSTVLSSTLTQDINIGASAEIDSKHTLNNQYLFLYQKYDLAPYNLNIGLRLDHNEYFNEHLTYKIGVSKNYDTFTLRSSFSSGFRAPSLNQLFDSTTGNKNLKPETSQSVDAGIDFMFAIHKVSTTLFYSDLKNRLSYDPARNYLNINDGQAMMKGIEQTFVTQINADMVDKLKFNLIESYNLKTNRRLERRPEISFSHDFILDKGNHSFDFETIYKGNRTDVNNSGAYVSTSKYWIDNLNYAYKKSEFLKFSLQVKNIFNSQYQEVWGYRTGGRLYALGLNYKF